MHDSSQLWDSPIIGMYLIWKIVLGYQATAKRGMPILLIFLALALIETPVFYRVCQGKMVTRLGDLVREIKNSSGKDSISLGALTEEIDFRRESYRKSLEFAMVAKLITIDAASATLRAAELGESKKSLKFCKDFDAEEGNLALHVGAWLAQEDAATISTMTGVNF